MVPEQVKKKKKDKSSGVHPAEPILKDVPADLQPAASESPRTIVKEKKKKGFFSRFKSKSSSKTAATEQMSPRTSTKDQPKTSDDVIVDSEGDSDDDDIEGALSEKEKERLEEERVAFLKEIGYVEGAKEQYPPEVCLFVCVHVYILYVQCMYIYSVNVYTVCEVE